MTTRFYSLLALLCLTALIATAQDSSVIRKRMEQRLPAIDSLKAQQVAGENNRGLLEARGAASPAQLGLIAEENNDRNAVYEILAKQTGASSADVGRSRAKRIAAGSAPGIWLQDEAGRWYRR